MNPVLMILANTVFLDVAGNVEDRAAQVVRLEHGKNSLNIAAEVSQTENDEIGDGRSEIPSR